LTLLTSALAGEGGAEAGRHERKCVIVGIARRMALLFRIKANRALDRAEDPREVLDYSYARQVEMLARVRRELADVTAGRERTEHQLCRLRRSAERLQQQAVEAVGQNRNGLAREALRRRSAALAQASELQPHRETLKSEEDKLRTAGRRLHTKVETFRARKETIKATYSAAGAQSNICEAVSGMSEEMGDVSLAMERAEDTIARQRSHALGLDELLASKALDDASLPIARCERLQAAVDAAEVDTELERLKSGTWSALAGQNGPGEDPST
jgi:phage shock protein A